MGADVVTMKFEGKATWAQITSKLAVQRKLDNEENGHRDGYSGDWQTISDRDIKDLRHKEFSSANEAYDWCQKNVEKWEGVVVTYKVIDRVEDTKPMQKLSQRVRENGDKLRQLKTQPVKLAKFVTCECCGSKVASSHLNGRMRCPVCNEGDFRPLTLQRKIDKLDKKIKDDAAKLETMRKALVEKAAAKSKKVNTLVYGVAAC